MWKTDIRNTILYEDREIIVCHKPAGLAVQNARIGMMDMESALKNYLAEKNPKEMPYLGIISRLDQPVEGILVFARSGRSAAELNRQMGKNEIEKIYLAVSDREPAQKEAELEDYLKKDGRNNTSAVTPPGTKGAKKARLTYRALETLPDQRTDTGIRCLIQVRLDTGRHHQIRVQLSHAGVPLLGDKKYYPQDRSGFSLGLCAVKLGFRHPASGKKMEFQTTPRGNAFEGFNIEKNC